MCPLSDPITWRTTGDCYGISSRLCKADWPWAIHGELVDWVSFGDRAGREAGNDVQGGDGRDLLSVALALCPFIP